MTSRPRLAAVCCGAWLIASLSCGGSPTSPEPPPPQPQPAPNTVPVIEAINLSTDRVEVGGETTLTALVRDAETPVGQLRYEWSAGAGSFSGQGATVVWRAPDSVTSPQDVVMTLTVIEQYGAATGQGAQAEHRVMGTSPVVRVHDSPREVRDLSLSFLGDFANSSVPASECVRSFSDSCQGKADELIDVQDNRRDFLILASSVTVRSVSLNAARTRADVVAPCAFTSRVLLCPAGRGPGCVVGAVVEARGDCLLTAVYEQRRWWLCESRFASQLPMSPMLRAFFGDR